MAFLLYKKTKLNAALQYRRIENVPLAGSRRGLIHSACQGRLRNRPVGWTLTEKDILKAAGHNASEYAVVIDTAPYRRGKINLFEIKSILGYSYAEWTPLMLILEELFADKPGNVRRGKRSFSDAECSRRIVKEFLYLTGGYATGSWNWGGNSRTTAALLWPEAWRYFQRQGV